MEKVVLNFKTHLRSLNQEELIDFLTSLGTPRYRASQILGWLHKKHVMDFSEMKTLPKELRVLLSEKANVCRLELLETPKSSNRESLKYLMKTEDGHILESVLITQGGRRTVCVSTQLGCRIRCSFCASGKGKFGRNLTAGEMVEQVSVISRSSRASITNVVFMGMGEPLDNYEATMRAIEILTADWGFSLGGRRITVSTSGITPMIEKFVKDSRGRVRLSISLHSSDQETRSRLVPINKKYRLAELVETLEKIQKTLKREITFEYTLIQGVNDSKEEARGVGRIASRLGAKVNLIPYNPIREMDYKIPDRGQVEVFQNLLEAKNVRVTVRQTAGRDIDAACGQLRLDRVSSL
ncbi:MAG: 23S rRNA (adenine(2503)-C(2))-methyltransferase RlmN [Candidatus Omnitrophica bacterium]|nr:23S rRNA (adenine(2503)-C(2))-methyltransferase RlmN [Candidatus Omnitrophota bacterium]